jgi:phage baseplate assembly protein W
MARAPNPVLTSSLTPMLGSGWSFPIARDGFEPQQLAMAYDERSVRHAIAIILSTRKGERAMRPDFGCNLDRLLFAPNNGATQALAAFEVSEALKDWEPRIEVLDVTVRAGGDGGEALLIDIDYRVRSTDNRFNFVYPFYLDRALV